MSAPPVVPGLAIQYRPAAGLDTVVFQRSITRGGRDSSAGVRTVVRRVITTQGDPPRLEVEQRFPVGNGEIVDTAVADLRTLRAVSHRSHQPTKTMRFAFPDSEAEGTVEVHGSAGDSVMEVRQPLGGPVFDSNVIDLVVSALPLRQGFASDLPFFIYERGGRVVIPVAVRERATSVFQLGEREVWIVDIGVPGVPATAWVDTRSGALLRIRYVSKASGVSFTDERVTPLDD